MTREHREDRPAEMPAVRTTIVGGRPPGSGTTVGVIPRGVEILIQKAAVDPDFKVLLLEKRAEAAAEIELTLEPGEAAMLNAVSAAQLGAIIDRTKVPEATRRALLGKITAATLATLGVGIFVKSCIVDSSLGIRPDRLELNSAGARPATKGIRPDRIEVQTAGIRPGEQFAPTEGIPDEVIEPDATEQPPDQKWGATRGIRPDRPPTSLPAEPGDLPRAPE